MTLRPQDLAGWVPIRVTVGKPEPVIDWCDLGDYEFTDPFFAGTLARAFAAEPDRTVIRTTLSALAEIEAVAPGPDPVAIVFHVSRCGSTLVSSLAQRHPELVVLAEPEPLNALVELNPASLHEDVWVLCLRLIVRALARGLIAKDARPRRVVLKTSSWNLMRVELLRRAFPQVPRVLVMREPAAVLASLLAEPPGWLLLRERAPAQARWLLGAEAVDLGSPADFAIHTSEQFYRAALAADDEASMTLIDYRDLPRRIWDELLPRWTGGVDLALRAELEAASRYHAKRPGDLFIGRDRPTRSVVEPTHAEAVAARLDPLYAELTARRARRPPFAYGIAVS